MYQAFREFVSGKQVMGTARKVTSTDSKVIEGDRRLGDPPIMVGSAEKADQILG